MKQKWRFVLLGLAALYFLYRGPFRTMTTGGGDFMMVYSASHCFLHHLNPYASEEVSSCAASAGAYLSASTLKVFPSVYPWSTYLVISPFALFSWPVARLIWAVCLIALSAQAILVFARLAPRDLWIHVSIFLLLFAHYIGGVGLGNPTAFVCGILILSVFTVPDGWISGLLLGLALALKPQLAAGFWLFCFWERKFQKAAVAATIAFGCLGAGYPLLPAGSIGSWIANVKAIGSNSGWDSGSPLNPGRWMLLNIDPLIPSAIYSQTALYVIYAIVAVVTIVSVWVTCDWKLAMALVAVSTLLIAYHGPYDSELLWFTLPFVLSLSLPKTAFGRWMMVLACGQFLIPSQAIAAQWLGVKESSAWALLILHHETITIVLAWIMLVGFAIRRHSGSERRVRQAELALQAT